MAASTAPFFLGVSSSAVSSTSSSSTAWYRPTCSAVIGQRSSSSMRSGSSAAITGSAFVRRKTSTPFMVLSADSAEDPASLALVIWAMKVERSPTRPGLTKSISDHRSPRPFSIGVPVSTTRVRDCRRRSCWAVSEVWFLMTWASSSTTLPQATSTSASMSRRAVP